MIAFLWTRRFPRPNLFIHRPVPARNDSSGSFKRQRVDFLFDPFQAGFPGQTKVVFPLQVDPKLRVNSEIKAEAKRCYGGDPTLAGYNKLEGRLGNPRIHGNPINRQPVGRDEFLEQDFSGRSQSNLFHNISDNLLAILAVHNNCHRAVIYQADLHVGPKFTGLNRPAKIYSKLADELLIKRDGNFRAAGTAVGRAVAFFGAGKQGELADQQNAAS